jgi:ubiquitin carboxyl-terminal hydrolase 48
VREQGEKRKLCISRFTTIKDIKVSLQDELNIPTICQRLYYQGDELGDNAATVTSLGILANDVLDLREKGEDKDALTSDSDDVPAKKKRREEGGGFGGTLLGGGSKAAVLPLPLTTVQPPVNSVKADEKPCTACTFSNPLSVAVCTVCGTAFS